MKKIFYTIYFFCLAIGFTSYAQHPVYTHLTEKDGLPDIEFYDILEDKEGFVWLAANKGLYRYDGKEFKNYKNSKKRGLSVFGLKLDSEGKVWCNNISGQFFYVKKDSLVLFKDLKNMSLGQLPPFLIYNNNLVASTFLGVYEVDLNSEKENKLFERKGSANSLYVKNDTLFNFLNLEIKFTTKEAKTGTKYDVSKYERFEYNKWEITSINNKLLVYAYNTNDENRKPILLYEKKGELEEVKLPVHFRKNTIIKFYEIENRLWICSKDGVYVYTLNNGELNLEKSYFKGKEISGVLKDRNNNYWITTLRSGVYIIPNLEIEKYNLTEEKTNITALSNLGENSLIFGTTKGDIGVLSKDNELVFLQENYQDKVYSICEIEGKAYISLGTKSLLYNKSVEKIDKIKLYNNAKDLSVLDNENIVYASYNSANIISVKNETIYQLKNSRAYTTYINKEKIYVGYVDGVECYDKTRKARKIEFKNKPIFAIDIDETSDGIIWISTFKDGLIGVKDAEVIVNYTTENGLLSNQTGKIKGDGKFLWVATDKGIQMLDVSTGVFKNLTKKDGINSFNISEIIPKKNDVYFSSNKGLFKINKEKAFRNRKIFDFYFTSILIDDKQVEQKDKYVIHYENKKIQFNFHTNGYLSQKNIKYRYKLIRDGKTEKWNDVSEGIDQITFSDLAAGKYVFKLKSVGNDDGNQTKIKTIELVVKPPFYKEWWFVLLLLSLLFFFVWFYFSNRIEQLAKKQNELLEKERMQKQLVASKLESLQSQMNPHFTFNALNSIQNLVLKGEKYEAYDYLTKFSLLIRENLSMSKKSFVTFDEELKMLIKYLDLEKLRFRDNFEYEIEILNNISDIKIPTMIIQPYVENAIKHGLLNKVSGERKLILSFEKTDLLKCIVQDNGVGIERAIEINKTKQNNRESFSTEAIQDRMTFLKEYYKMDIGVFYEEIKEGTKVIIKIPYTIEV